MNRFSLIFVSVSSFFLATGFALAAEPGSVLKTDTIMAEPFQDARPLGSLTVGDKVEILNRQGGWYQIKSAKGSGWVRMLSIRRGAAQTGSPSGTASGVLGLASGRAGTGSVVATTGIRGLNEEELKAAKFNEADLKKLESYTVSRKDARKFAEEAKLVSQKIEYLPEPVSSQEEQP